VHAVAQVLRTDALERLQVLVVHRQHPVGRQQVGVRDLARMRFVHRVAAAAKHGHGAGIRRFTDAVAMRAGRRAVHAFLEPRLRDALAEDRVRHRRATQVGSTDK